MFDNGFLKNSFSYLVTLNVDWFQPFQHTNYSVGAIYLIVQNLPRYERYKDENLILVGVLPGPHLLMNSYLTPLVNELELKEAYHTGFKVHAPKGYELTLHLLLSCVSCDIPASRKVCGFLGHNSKLGCNKCLKVFEGAPGEHDYSGFDHSDWTMRNSVQHRENCNKIMLEKTETNIANAQTKFGCVVYWPQVNI